jgi:hypothetical protein
MFERMKPAQSLSLPGRRQAMPAIAIRKKAATGESNVTLPRRFLV